MILCPFCHFHNEDGALFCEQCKSDLSGVPEVPAEPMAAEPIMAVPLAEDPIAAMPVGEPESLPPPPPYGFAPPPEPPPVAAVPVMDEVEAEPIEAVPAEPVASDGPVTPWPAPQPVVEAPPEPVAPPPPKAPPPPPKASPAPPPAAAAPAPAPKGEAASGDPVALPAGAQPRLLVVRGQKRNVEYPVYEGLNFIGRADEKPVDIDLEDQEPPDRIWCSRQHALISFEDSRLFLEDLNSANGTYLNRARVYPGQKQALKVNDVIQIGNVQLKVIV